MGDGVTGSTNAPANQTTNADRSGASSAADTAAHAEFGKAIRADVPEYSLIAVYGYADDIGEFTWTKLGTRIEIHCDVGGYE
jgi:hypothetical protein